MASPIQIVARLAFQTFSRQSDKTFHESLTKLREAVRKIRADDVKFDQNLVQNRMEAAANSDEPIPPVTYIPVSENEIFTMGIFVLKHGTRIPLHDHPGMHGVLKVIHGSICIRSYTPVEADIEVEEVGATSSKQSQKSWSPSRSPSLPSRSPSVSPTWSPSSSPSTSLKLGQLLASVRSFDVIENPEVEVGISDDVCMVLPREGNLHEIRATNGAAAFLDILAPPYVKHQRDCHYYAIEAHNEGFGSSRSLRVRETRSPHDFWTDSAEYLGPPVEVFPTAAAEQA